MRNADLLIIKLCQRESFAEAFRDLAANRRLPKKSKLAPLNPYIDKNGLLRVGGRLHNAEVSAEIKNPFILCHEHHVTKLIVAQTHKQTLHAGPTLMTSILRERYWIIGCRNLVRHYVRRCVVCCRHKAETAKHLMGSLPHPRVNAPGRAFLQVGIDYAGPITLKMSQGRCRKTSKGYIAVFICFATKAIHVELVSDLTSDSFIASLKRFIGRRGKPSDIYSDNATNFVGANRELAELKSLLTSEHLNEQVTNFLMTDFINWHFIPPASPHMAGLWEAGVKTIKHHIRRSTANQILTFEEMNTLLVQIEAIVNSRPLCQLSENYGDLDALTPGHFLIGTPLTALPEPLLETISQNRLSRWQMVQRQVQQFWTRWRRDYISTLQQRTRWQHQERNIKIGDLVLLKDDNLPPSTWLLGRIEACYPGKDGVVRVADVRTKTGTFKRTIQKLVKLPVD